MTSLRKSARPAARTPRQRVLDATIATAAAALSPATSGARGRRRPSAARQPPAIEAAIRAAVAGLMGEPCPRRQTALSKGLGAAVIARAFEAEAANGDPPIPAALAKLLREGPPPTTAFERLIDEMFEYISREPPSRARRQRLLREAMRAAVAGLQGKPLPSPRGINLRTTQPRPQRRIGSRRNA